MLSPGNDDERLNFGVPLVFILSSSEEESEASSSAAGRVLEVDRRGGAEFASLREAAKASGPGDVIRIAPGSGPYREVLEITNSGRAGAPIVVEGNGELVTGFEPLEGFRKSGDAYVCDLPVEFPFVLTHKGERVAQDAETKQFGELAKLSEDQRQLQLLPGVSPESWEISTRTYVVKVWNVSHHIYRDLRASGAQNDAFNLHGVGEHLVFENVEGFHSLDEGFSAHDDISCEVHGGEFYGNDNGLVNIADSKMVASNLEIRGNLGWGLYLLDCEAVLDDVLVEENGLAQIMVANSVVEWNHVTAVMPSWNDRRWVTYNESSGKEPAKAPLVTDRRSQVSGTLPKLVGGSDE
ncbi:right-handed parallel beta-helix repeat-containing protein [Puniceicoccus vermicola]|uniref:Right-handed parallel beta-helix repeat-containing protein n=1 Tax=Puniceicoccus vermicola TaxID=388746 RepID=A0A7X1E5N3_9BACT|nr:right-handed parallel beta-helix repeat-containing protein [Puniceicoccus vermicola]